MYASCITYRDDEGRIVLWHGYDTPNVVTSHLHWHAHSVSALAFTDDGSFFFFSFSSLLNLLPCSFVRLHWFISL